MSWYFISQFSQFKKLKKPKKVKDLSIGNIAPIPNQRATAVAIKKIVVATGRQNGFWNLFYTYPLLLSNIG